MSPDEISEVVGELLAGGYGDFEIITRLQQDEELSEADAILALRTVYDTWQDVGTRLAIVEQDTRNWHLKLRLKILRVALGQETVNGGTLALRVLDSLAALQGLQPEYQALAIPLEIRLVEKEQKDDTKGEDGAGINPGESGGA